MLNAVISPAYASIRNSVLPRLDAMPSMPTNFATGEMNA